MLPLLRDRRTASVSHFDFVGRDGTLTLTLRLLHSLQPKDGFGMAQRATLSWLAKVLI